MDWIIKKAEQFCTDHGIDTYPVKIVEICIQDGYAVYKDDLKKISGVIMIQDENIDEFKSNKVIIVNSKEPALEQRFTIAHELAHAILHCKNNKLYAHRDEGQKGGIETEADIFASHILMPQVLLMEFLRETFEADKVPFRIAVKKVSNAFNVPEDVVRRRLDKILI